MLLKFSKKLPPTKLRYKKKFNLLKKCQILAQNFLDFTTAMS